MKKNIFLCFIEDMLSINRIQNANPISFSAVTNRKKTRTYATDTCEFDTKKLSNSNILAKKLQEYFIEYEDSMALLSAIDRTDFDVCWGVEFKNFVPLFEKIEKKGIANLKDAEILGHGKESIAIGLISGDVLKISTSRIPEVANNVINNPNHPLNKNIAPYDKYLEYILIKGSKEKMMDSKLYIYVQQRLDTKNISENECDEILKKFEENDVPLVDKDYDKQNKNYYMGIKKQFGKDKDGNIRLVDYGALEKKFYNFFRVNGLDLLYFPKKHKEIALYQRKDNYPLERIASIAKRLGEKGIIDNSDGSMTPYYDLPNGDILVFSRENNKDMCFWGKNTIILGEPHKVTYDFENGKLTRKAIVGNTVTALYEPCKESAIVKTRGKIRLYSKKENEKPYLITVLTEKDGKKFESLDKYLQNALE